LIESAITLPGDDGSGIPGVTMATIPAQGQMWPRGGVAQTSPGHAIQDEGTALTTRSALNFVGAGVTATDDSANARTVVTIGGSTAPSRQTATITTASLANNAQETGTVTLAKGYRLLRLTTDKAARVRLYSTTAKRDADLARAVGTDPTGDHGVMFDFVTTAPPVTNQSAFTSQTPNTDDTSGAGVVWGNDILFAKAGIVTALKAYRKSSDGMSSRTLKLWSSAGVELGSAATSGETGTGWVTATLSSGVNVSAAQTLRVSDGTVGGGPRHYTSSPQLSNFTNGDLTYIGTGWWDNGAGRPNSTIPWSFFVDVVYQASSSGPLTADLSPVVDGFDGKTTPDGIIPYTITNLSGATGTVTATLTWISTE
jgi:uncharacterized protein DUF4082